MAQKFIGVTLPLRRGPTGMFEQSVTVHQQVRSNFMNLMLTKKGERIMLPEFGCNLHSILFEQSSEDTLELAKLAVTDAVEQWMPFLEVANIALKGDAHNIHVKVTYRFRNNLNVSDIVDFTVKE